MSEAFVVYPQTPDSEPGKLSAALNRAGVFFEIKKKMRDGSLAIDLLDPSAHARREFINTVRENTYDF